MPRVSAAGSGRVDGPGQPPHRVAHVPLEEPGRGRRVPLLNRLYDLRVLGDQVGPARVESFERDHAQPGLGRQGAEHPGQPLAPGAAHQDLVQLQVEAGQLVPVVSGRGPELGERGGQVGEGLGGPRAGQLLGGGNFHRAPGQVQVGDVAGGQLRDEDAPGRVRLEQALLDQALEGLPDRAPADAELARDLDLPQGLTRRQPSGDDARAQLRGDPFRRRIPAQRLKHIVHAHLPIVLMWQLRDPAARSPEEPENGPQTKPDRGSGPRLPTLIVGLLTFLRFSE